MSGDVTNRAGSVDLRYGAKEWEYRTFQQWDYGHGGGSEHINVARDSERIRRSQYTEGHDL